MNATTAARRVPDAVAEFHARGFRIILSVLSEAECDSLAAELTGLFEHQRHTARNRIGGVRNVLRRSSQVRELVNAAKLLSPIQDVTGRAAFPVRAIFFDKTPESNWRVPWHQDLTIAVRERIETVGFGPWSVKEGVVHVQPQLEILAGMVALRLHLDDCRRDNGALRVIPGSHLEGELNPEQIAAMTGCGRAVDCELEKGGILLMCPLLLHASSPATSPAHRRVLHVEYAADELPNGLQWHDR